MTKFVVFYRMPYHDALDTPLTYVCEADDEDHAADCCTLYAHPDAEVIEVIPKAELQAQVKAAGDAILASRH